MLEYCKKDKYIFSEVFQMMHTILWFNIEYLFLLFEEIVRNAFYDNFK